MQFTGPLNNDTRTIGGLSYAAAGSAGAAAGWALVSNLYPVPLDWRTVGTAPGSGLNGTAYVFQSTSTYGGRYTIFISNVGAGPGPLASGPGLLRARQHAGTTGGRA